MFGHLSKYHRILVTGPQRSGTRICTKMIACDTGHKFVGEEQFDNAVGRFWEILKRNNVVVHCPAMCWRIHDFVNSIAPHNTLVVLMRRNIADIEASQNRIAWGSEETERRKYNCMDGPIAKCKYRLWEEKQRDALQHTLEIKYESLQKHTLWIPKDERLGFTPLQTER